MNWTLLWLFLKLVNIDLNFMFILVSFSSVWVTSQFFGGTQCSNAHFIVPVVRNKVQMFRRFGGLAPTSYTLLMGKLIWYPVNFIAITYTFRPSSLHSHSMHIFVSKISGTIWQASQFALANNSIHLSEHELRNCRALHTQNGGHYQ